MTDHTPIECEARLMGFKKESRADGEWTSLTFQIHPHETPHALFLLPLKTHVMLAISGVAEAADEQTDDAATERPKGTEGWSEAKRKMVRRAALICKEEAFQSYIANGYRVMWNHERHGDAGAEEKAAYYVRTCCGVRSRSDIDPTEESGTRFLDLINRYEAAQPGQTTEDYQTMAEDRR